MPDERQDSIRQGIHAPEESPSGSAAERERLQKLAQDRPIDSAMGGTSDAGRPGDDAQMNAARSASGNDTPQGLEERSRVIRESREASLRAEGGGSSDEHDIDRAAREDQVGG